MIYWRARNYSTKTLWQTYGDKNTKKIHHKASQSRRKNSIEYIQDVLGNKISDPKQIQNSFVNYFKDLFTSQNLHKVEETVEVVKNKITKHMLEDLNKPFTSEEVYCAIKDMRGLVAPEPNGIPTLFFHRYWDVIGHETTQVALDILNRGDPTPFNTTHICLIPKGRNPCAPSDYRPISLCNVTLKIITKTIANRLKPILSTIISQNQSTLLPGRLISDNSLIAFDIFHYFNQTTSSKGHIGIKTDMAKAYERIEWHFLKATLSSMGFPEHLITTIMKCVTTVSFSILINGAPSKAFNRKRGLRQGDPFSPYLFIICVDVLSGLLTQANNNKSIHGVKIANGAPEITHILFADDSLIFWKATKEEANHVMGILNQYQEASGQKVNLDKSEFILSKKMHNDSKADIKQILQMKHLDSFSKYLGFPTVLGRSKRQVFDYVQDRIWKKLKGWKEKHLSFPGRSVLIKAVAQAIPTYIMSNFLFPKGFCEYIEKMVCKFW